jgi:UDP-GlcNAc:undecaprenyl-phosphate/decaprenyl-phosphate GlcNAc-1-phosphate transferase
MQVINALILLFLFALVFSLILTPGIREMGIRFGAMDIPMARKVHTNPIPRVGGIALFIVLVLSRFLPLFFPSMVELFKFKPLNWYAFSGLLVVFGCGVWDDFRRLNPWIKLLFQILGASLAFAGGIAIERIFFVHYGFVFCFLCSYFITVFWFLLFINAVNLIDGLDGLASGVVLFTCILMAILTYVNGDYASAFYFCVLGGAILGFLRYNFNPADIFLGDGGSYFLGYFMALLAIQSSTKSQVGVFMLIPLLALGVPIFDTIFSPIRRWILGREIFHPDRGHFHHHLLKLGFSSRNAVLIIYGITLVFCLMSILLIAFRGKGMEGLFLALLLFCLIFIMHRLGYIEYLAVDKFYGWFKDVTDVAGISQTRRSFLSLQIAAGKSQSMDELWEHLIEALEMLKINEAQLYLQNKPVRKWKAPGGNTVLVSPDAASGKEGTVTVDGLLKVELPLRNDGDEHFMGKLILVKDLKLDRLQPFTIRRIEHLRRTLIPALKRLKSGE